MVHNININGTEHPFRYGYGALFRVEEAIGSSWGEAKQNMYTQFLLMYSCLHNADSGFPYTFDEFVLLCDEDNGIFTQCNDALMAQIAQWGKPKKADDGSDKKKE